MQLAIFTALSSSQPVADFTPTGYLRDDAQCVDLGRVDCSRIYESYVKPSCDGCPDHSGFPHDMCNNIVSCATATNVDYAKAAFQFNTAQPEKPNPCSIIMAENVQCIQAAVKHVRNLRESSQHRNLSLALRGGRHSYIGVSTASKGVIIDVSQIKTFALNLPANTITMGAGNTLVEVYANLWNLTEAGVPQNVQTSRSLFPGGTCPTVGISGLSLGGGQGIIGRRYGLSADNVVRIEMVNATGDVVIADRLLNPDLYWALRGGGNGNFGVVYQFELQHYVIPEYNYDVLVYYYNSQDWLAVFQKWQEFLRSDYFVSNDFVWCQLTITQTKLQVAAHISANSTSQVDEFRNQFQNFFILIANVSPSGYIPRSLDPTSNHTECMYTPANYTGAMAFWAGCTTNNTCGTQEDFEKCQQLPTECCGKPFNMNSGYQKTNLSEEGMQLIIDKISGFSNDVNCANNMAVSVQMDSLGGVIAKPNNDTAFPHRDNFFGYQYLTYFSNKSNCGRDTLVPWLNSFYGEMEKYMGNGSYRNYPNLDLTKPDVRYYLSNLQRLTSVKCQYDRENFFSSTQGLVCQTMTGSEAESLSWTNVSFPLPLVVALVIGGLFTCTTIFHRLSN